MDEIHNLNHHTRAGADASDHLKYLAENVAATFVYAGIDTARTGLFNDVRGRQLAGRFVPIHTQPFGYSTTADRVCPFASAAVMSCSVCRPCPARP